MGKGKNFVKFFPFHHTPTPFKTLGRGMGKEGLQEKRLTKNIFYATVS